MNGITDNKRSNRGTIRRKSPSSKSSGDFYDTESVLISIYMRGTYILSCQKTATKRGVRNDRHAELACRAEKVNLWVLNVQSKRRVFDLDGRDRVDSMSTPKGGGGHF